eukprot:GHVU01059055.1.p1 GENE.GHVU01059055.1~~GHVU01059055.1.p1  ORF type:complete len:278 (-),score=35.19 GHVU01059055.1:1230-2063(-)
MDTIRTRHGPGQWGYVCMSERFMDVPLQFPLLWLIRYINSFMGKTNVIAQTSKIDSMLAKDPAEGSFLMLKHHKFYDFTLTMNINPGEGGGAVGVGFRVRDEKDMYFFEMTHKGKRMKRLFKIVQGEKHLLAQIEDGGYIGGSWHQIVIDATRDVIEIRVGLPDGIPFKVLAVQDQAFSAGSIALFSAGCNSGAYFDSVKLQAKACQRSSASQEPPPPKTCSNYKESFFSNSMTGSYELVRPSGFIVSSHICRLSLRANRPGEAIWVPRRSKIRVAV